MTTHRFYPLLASAVLSLLLASATAAQASTSVAHVNGPNASFSFCEPDSNPTVCRDAYVSTNQGSGGTNDLTVFYNVTDLVNGVQYFGFGLAVPHSVFIVTGQSATLNVNIDTFTNGCFTFDPTGTCTPLSNGNITVSWKVNGLSSSSTDGSNAESFSGGFSFKQAGHTISQGANVQGTMFGFNFDNQQGSLGRTDNVMLSITTTP